jgi:hypothetical protein
MRILGLWTSLAFGMLAAHPVQAEEELPLHHLFKLAADQKWVEAFDYHKKYECSSFRRALNQGECIYFGVDKFGDKIEIEKTRVGQMLQDLQDDEKKCQAFAAQPKKRIDDEFDELCGRSSPYAGLLLSIKSIADVDLIDRTEAAHQLYHEALADQTNEAKRAGDEEKERLENKRIAEEAYRKTASFTRDQLCVSEKQIAFLQSTLDRERKVGSVSGVVDKKVLYQYGNYLVSEREHQSQLLEEYRKRSGKPFIKSECKNAEKN